MPEQGDALSSYTDAAAQAFVYTRYALFGPLFLEKDVQFADIAAPYRDDSLRERFERIASITAIPGRKTTIGVVNSLGGGMSTVCRMVRRGLKLGLDSEQIMERSMRAARVTLEQEPAMQNAIGCDIGVLLLPNEFREFLANFGYAQSVGCPARLVESEGCREYLARHGLPRVGSTAIRDAVDLLVAGYHGTLLK